MYTITSQLVGWESSDELCLAVRRLMLACPRRSCHSGLVAIDEPVRAMTGRLAMLVRRGRILEGITLGWNVAGIVVLAVAAVTARSVALAGFGLDSLIETGASTVVLWELAGTGEDRQRRALRLIGGAFLALAAYLTVQSVLVLMTGYRPGHSVPGITWTALTAAAMFALAAGKARTGKALGNPVLVTGGPSPRRRRPCRPASWPVGFQNSATGPGLGFYAARSYSLMRPPRTGRRWMRLRYRSATG